MIHLNLLLLLANRLPGLVRRLTATVELRLLRPQTLPHLAAPAPRLPRHPPAAYFFGRDPSFAAPYFCDRTSQE